MSTVFVLCFTDLFLRFYTVTYGAGDEGHDPGRLLRAEPAVHFADIDRGREEHDTDTVPEQKLHIVHARDRPRLLRQSVQRYVKMYNVTTVTYIILNVLGRQ